VTRTSHLISVTSTTKHGNIHAGRKISYGTPDAHSSTFLVLLCYYTFKPLPVKPKSWSYRRSPRSTQEVLLISLGTTTTPRNDLCCLVTNFRRSVFPRPRSRSSRASPTGLATKSRLRVRPAQALGQAYRPAPHQPSARPELRRLLTLWLVDTAVSP
jgi:hypothetical protein